MLTRNFNKFLPLLKTIWYKKKRVPTYYRCNLQYRIVSDLAKGFLSLFASEMQSKIPICCSVKSSPHHILHSSPQNQNRNVVFKSYSVWSISPHKKGWFNGHLFAGHVLPTLPSHTEKVPTPYSPPFCRPGVRWLSNDSGRSIEGFDFVPKSKANEPPVIEGEIIKLSI